MRRLLVASAVLAVVSVVTSDVRASAAEPNPRRHNHGVVGTYTANTPQAAAPSGTYVYPNPYGAGSISCVTSSTAKKWRIIYARPSGAGDRYSSLLPWIRQAVYDASGYMDDQMGNRSVRLKFQCPSGSTIPTVASVALPTSAAAANILTIERDLRAKGYNKKYEHYMVFYDGTLRDDKNVATAGIATMYDDRTAGSTNIHNGGSNAPDGIFAVEGNWRGGMPTWEVFLHEMSHTMGAVQDGAPYSDQATHVINAMFPAGTGDIMLASIDTYYGRSYYDYGWDSYADPRGTAGTGWLAQNWNLAGPNNAFLTRTCEAASSAAYPKVC
jgi:hypothetical protein